MNITRREFIKAAPALAGAVIVFQSTGLAQGLIETLRPGQTDGFSNLSWASFLPYVNTEFSFFKGSYEIPLKLVDMTDTAPFTGRQRPAGQESFIMRFAGPSKMPLEQGTYRVNHFQLGDFEMFITEGGTKGKNKTYFAVVNRIVS